MHLLDKELLPQTSLQFFHQNPEGYPQVDNTKPSIDNKKPAIVLQAKQVRMRCGYHKQLNIYAVSLVLATTPSAIDASLIPSVNRHSYGSCLCRLHFPDVSQFSTASCAQGGLDFRE